MIPKLNDILNMTSHLSGDWTQFETHNFSRHWTRVGFQNPHIGHVWLFHKDRVLATPNQRQSPGRHPRRAGEWTPHDAAFRWMIDRHPETGSPGTVELYIYMPRDGVTSVLTGKDHMLSGWWSKIALRFQAHLVNQPQ